MTNSLEKFQIIRDKVCFGKYNYQGKETYNILIFKTLQEIIKEKANIYYQGHTNVVFDYEDERKILILNILSEVVDFNNSSNDTLIEKSLELICKKLNNCDYEYSTQTDCTYTSNPIEMYQPISINQQHLSQNYHSNNFSESLIKNNEKTIKQIDTLHQQNLQIEVEYQYLQQNKVFNTDRAFNSHYITINLLTVNDLIVCKDLNNKLCFRSKAFEKMQKITKSQLKDIAKNILGYYVDIYDSSDEVIDINSKYIIIALLPSIRKSTFNPYLDAEFISIANNLIDINTFEYTNLLKARFQDTTKILNTGIFVEKFINTSFKDAQQTNFFMELLSSYPKKSNIAVALIGDSETTDILVNDIIRPIFAKKRVYISIIDDNILKKEEDEEILKEKILYHFNELNGKSEIKRVSKLIRNILKSNPITNNQSCRNDEDYIYGNLIITSSKDSPYSYLKDVYSNCVVLRVKHLDTILNTLNLDRSALDRDIESGLEDFVQVLKSCSFSYDNLTILNTYEKANLHTMKNSILITPEIDFRINQFINDVRTKKVNAFVAIKKYDEEIYKEFLLNLEESMIAQPMLSTYFNIICGDVLIPNNTEFINILQQKTEMFRDAPNDKSKANGKKRYKIF